METKHLIFPISVIAEILGVHQRTLRIYDKKGLLVPDRNSHKRRQYSFEDLEKGRLIQFLTKTLGVNLTGIKIIIYLLQNAKIKESDYLKTVKEIAKTENLVK
jgi:MerR family transcriptional regulator, heat shock protein HspR